MWTKHEVRETKKGTDSAVHVLIVDYIRSFEATKCCVSYINGIHVKGVRGLFGWMFPGMICHELSLVVFLLHMRPSQARRLDNTREFCATVLSHHHAFPRRLRVHL